MNGVVHALLLIAFCTVNIACFALSLCQSIFYIFFPFSLMYLFIIFPFVFLFFILVLFLLALLIFLLLFFLQLLPILLPFLLPFLLLNLSHPPPHSRDASSLTPVNTFKLEPKIGCEVEDEISFRGSLLLVCYTISLLVLRREGVVSWLVVHASWLDSCWLVVLR